jgi:hypothetical protein
MTDNLQQLLDRRIRLLHQLIYERDHMTGVTGVPHTTTTRNILERDIARVDADITTIIDQISKEWGSPYPHLRAHIIPIHGQ